MPGNVLFDGGAGETVCRELLKQPDVHTTANPQPKSPERKSYGVYDLRTNHHFNLKEKTPKRSA